MSTAFTDEELLSYAEERLPAARATELERLLRTSTDVMNRLTTLMKGSDAGDQSLGAMWRRGRWSCPPRAIWSAYVDGRLGDGLSQYLNFHVETIGCRICAANLADLQQNSSSADSEGRVRKIFQSSAGRLSNELPPKAGK